MPLGVQKNSRLHICLKMYKLETLYVVVDGGNRAIRGVDVGYLYFVEGGRDDDWVDISRPAIHIHESSLRRDRIDPGAQNRRRSEGFCTILLKEPGSRLTACEGLSKEDHSTMVK